ncbi:MAG: hypothetical protein IJ867_00340 [Clostridia bacterium]|nr:hypothetical protein [Clostridia bacterium]
MDSNIDISVALESVNRKISEINLMILEKDTEELQEELAKFLRLRQEIYDGNEEVIRKILDNEI